MSDTAAAPAADPALRMEVATIATDPNRWVYGNRLLPQDEVLAGRGAGKGLRLYDELERDPKVGTVLAKRRDALIGREWSLDPADDSPAAQDAADVVKRAIGGARFNRSVESALDALLKGVSVLEAVWAVSGNELVPAKLLARDPQRFAFRAREEGGDELRLLTRTQPLDGVPVPPRKFIVHRHGGKYENPWGLGLGNRLFWPVYFKRQGVGFWLSAIEKFAVPTALGKYPKGSTDGEIGTLLDALQAVASEAGVAIPEGMAVELLEAKRAGAFDSYEKLCRYMDEDITQVVLGETLTTSAGDQGSRALGEVHNGVRLEVTKADADRLSDTLNSTLVPWIVELNRPGAPVPKLWWDVSVPEDLNARADRDAKVKQLGYRPTSDYVRDTYGDGWEPDRPPPAPVPGPGIVQPPGAPSASAADGLAALFAEAGVAPRLRSLPVRPAGAGSDAPGDLAEQLEAVAAEAQDALVAALRDVVNRAGSLEEVGAELVKVFPTLPTAAIAELMGQAMSVAALSGRSDLADGVV